MQGSQDSERAGQPRARGLEGVWCPRPGTSLSGPVLRPHANANPNPPPPRLTKEQNASAGSRTPVLWVSPKLLPRLFKNEISVSSVFQTQTGRRRLPETFPGPSLRVPGSPHSRVKPRTACDQGKGPPARLPGTWRAGAVAWTTVKSGLPSSASPSKHGGPTSS